jgi:hypothetical protein
MTRKELEEKIAELVREYYENQDPEIPERLLELAGSFGSGTTELINPKSSHSIVTDKVESKP